MIGVTSSGLKLQCIAIATFYGYYYYYYYDYYKNKIRSDVLDLMERLFIITHAAARKWTEGTVEHLRRKSAVRTSLAGDRRQSKLFPVSITWL